LQAARPRSRAERSSACRDRRTRSPRPAVRVVRLPAGPWFDRDRLVDNLAPAVDDGREVTVVLPQGVSAAESANVARFRMYAWAIYHDKVQQIAAGLHRSLTLCAVPSSLPTPAKLSPDAAMTLASEVVSAELLDEAIPSSSTRSDTSPQHSACAASLVCASFVSRDAAQVRRAGILDPDDI
jgi:HD superfamily phosphohydrolase